MATRIGIIDTRAFVPENADEANGEIMGRCNALHDWLNAEAIQNSGSEYRSKPLSDDLQTVCVLMGFRDVLRIEMEKKPETTDK